MAVLARSSITLVTSVDIDSVYWFYLLQASTAAAPAKPTTVPATKGNAPSGWTTAEPTTVDINKTLYRVELTYFTDGTGVYSSVNKVSSYEAAKVAYNKATDVQTNLDDTYSKLQSMGEQLVVNGSAFTGDNTNFTAWTFDGAVANGTKGSFTKPSDWDGTPMINESFPIDITKRYRFEFDAKSKDKTARHYSFLNFYDVDGNTILANNHMYIANTLTTLAQDLKNGDTVVYLNDLTNWKVSTGTATHQRGLTFWNYKNSFGYQYPELTYSRNTWANLYTDANVNKTAKTITLSSPWTHGTFPAGTKVSQSNSGANYKYNPWSNSLVETEWTHYVGYYDGTDYSGNNVQTKFPPGAATAKVGFLWNYQKQSTTDQLWITNVSVMEDVKTSISNAQTTANNAATAASTAQSTANSASTAASNAQSTANSASTAAATAQATADAKKSMIKINTASRTFTTAQWKTYGAVGHSENWSTGSSYSNPNIKVGDTAYLIGTVSDGAKGTATIIGTVTAVNGTNGTSSITMTSQQLIFGGDSVDNVNTTANTAKNTADEAKTAATTATNTANSAKTAADNALINTKYNGPVNIGAAVTANRLIMNATTAANTAASYKMVAKNTAYNIESPILYSKTALSTGSKALADHTCYTIGDVTVTGQGGASSLTVNKPVFLKGTLSGTTFTTVNDATFLTQTQPTSSDGYHYIFLGTATSTTNVMLQAEHPIYMFIGGSFHRLGSSSDKILQKWVGSATAAVADAKLNGSYIQANTVTSEHIYVEDLNALDATIGGFTIGKTSNTESAAVHQYGLYFGSIGSDNSVALLPQGTTTSVTIGSHEGTDWRITAGSKFGVTAAGNLYAADAYLSNATISGTVTATYGKIGKWNIVNNLVTVQTAAGAPEGSLCYKKAGTEDSICLVAGGTLPRNVTIAGYSRNDWKVMVGTAFGIKANGDVVATNAVFKESVVAYGSLVAELLSTTGTLKDQISNSDISVYSWDHFVFFSGDGISVANFSTYIQTWCNGSSSGQSGDWRIKDGWRPIKNVWFPFIYSHNGFRTGCMQIRADGYINAYIYPTYGSGAKDMKTEYRNNNTTNITGSDSLFFNASWIRA